MKTPTIVVLLTIALCLLGCSKEGSAPKSTAKGIVPATGAEIVASPQFKLEHTTKSGVKCYTRAVTPEEYRSIPGDSRDHEYLTGDEKFSFFMIPIRDSKIVELTAEESFELTGFIMKKTMSENKEMQEMLKKAGNQ